jgi:hypothetical protein
MKGQIESTSKSSPDLIGLQSRGSHDKLMSLPVRQSDSAIVNDRRMAKHNVFRVNCVIWKRNEIMDYKNTVIRLTFWGK